MISSQSSYVRKNRLLYHVQKYWVLYLMALPAVLTLLIFSYTPMLGLVMAFKRLNLVKGIFASPFVGFKNFEFLFSTQDAWIITRNTVLYNVTFIALNTTLSLALAIVLNELLSKRMAKYLQTVFMMPHFLSMAVVSMLVFAFLGRSNGLVNSLLRSLGLEIHDWYQDRSFWPGFLVFVNAWKGVGYSAVIYLATVSGISDEYYEAAVIDGASKIQQVRYITLPYMRPVISIMLIQSIGGIFRSDFGLFYTVTRNQGVLYPVTNVIDTYIYNALTTLNNPGMATAAGLYQSVVGLVLVLISNSIIKKIDPDSGMF